MRWFKVFRDDLDKPSFSIGIEKFGLDFFFDVVAVWSFLCIENGPGVRKISLSDEVVKVLARKFRVKPSEALTRLKYMAEYGLVDISKQDGVEILGSAEIERRRDEWSRKAKKESTGESPEPLRSHAGESPDTEVKGQKSKVRDQSPESRDDYVTSNEVDGTATGRRCCLKDGNPWSFSGVDIERVPKKFTTGPFATLFQQEFEQFRNYSHEDGVCYCFPDEFLGTVREKCVAARIRYPEALLARQIQIERDAKCLS